MSRRLTDTSQHLPHPTDERRTIGRHFRTACGRWAGLTAFLAVEGRTVCPKCAVAQLLHELPARPEPTA